jgi:hypothetical protein
MTLAKEAMAMKTQYDLPPCLRFADLGATVHLGVVPGGLSEELPALYSSLFSTLDWFLAYDRAAPTGSCVLDEPHHVILFRHRGHTIDVLNQAFSCGTSEAERICRALFRAVPHADRIHISVPFSPRDLALPARLLNRLAHMVIDLPTSVDEYYGSLGKSTRRNVRRYQNLLHRTFPDVRTDIVKPGDDSRRLVDRLVEWKIERFRPQGRITYWETDPSLRERVSDALERCGEARITYISSKVAAIDVCFRVGRTAYVYESAHDPRFDPFSLGFLTFYWLACDAIRSGASCLNALEGTVEPKALLGAHPVRTTRLSVYRSQLGRLLALDEGLRTARRRCRSGYRRTRRAATQRVRRAPGGEALAQAVTRRRVKKLGASPEDPDSRSTHS